MSAGGSVGVSVDPTDGTTNVDVGGSGVDAGVSVSVGVVGPAGASVSGEVDVPTAPPAGTGASASVSSSEGAASVGVSIPGVDPITVSLGGMSTPPTVGLPRLP